MAARADLVQIADRSQTDWDALAARSKRQGLLGQSLLVLFLIIVSLPILLPYFWMLTISVSARTGGVETLVLWKACALLVPTVIGLGLLRMLTEDRTRRWLGSLAIVVAAIAAVIWSIGQGLRLRNWAFLWNPDMVAGLQGRGQATVESQFPWVWTAFANSLFLAVAQTTIVLTVSTLAGYYISRFQFAGRTTFLQSLLVLHAFPAMTLIIPIFLIMFWIGMLDTVGGVILVIATLELPFSIFIMKGFFDAVQRSTSSSAPCCSRNPTGS